MPLEVYLFHESHDICALNKGQPPVVAAITTICPWREGVKEIEVEMETTIHHHYHPHFF